MHALRLGCVRSQVQILPGALFWFIPGTWFTDDSWHIVYTFRHIAPKGGRYAVEGDMCHG